MSQEQHLEGETNALAALNPKQRDKKVVITFLVFCSVALFIVLWLIFSPNNESAPSKINLNTASHTGSGSTSTTQLKKTFSWLTPTPKEEADIDKEGNEKKIEDEIEKETKNTESIPQKIAPPNETKNTEERKITQIDKSQSSLGVRQSKGKDSGSLQLTPPPYPDISSINHASPSSFYDAKEDNNQNQGITSMLNTHKTQNAIATVLLHRDYLLAKGKYIDCVLNTSMNSTVAGMTKCTLTRDIYSDNGNTLLLERGSEVTGEYRANITQGQARLFVLWDRVKTPHGVVVDLASPATDSLGSSGVDGYIDTHFWARFGGAMMLSLVDDLAGYIATNGGKSNNNFENSSEAAQNMAAEALKNTINIPPTFYKNQGERIGIFIAHDIDFSKVYTLKVQ